MKTLSIGTQNRERLSISVLDYERTVCGEIFDDNWLTSKLEISVGSFSGDFGLSLTTQDFISFLQQLDSLYQTLKGQAKFETMEGQIEFVLLANGRGEIEVSGHVMDLPGIGNRLEFHFTIDQTYLLSALRDLHEITTKFPIRRASLSRNTFLSS